MWILLLAFHAATFSVVVDSEQACMEHILIKRDHWQATCPDVVATCLKAYDI